MAKPRKRLTQAKQVSDNGVSTEDAVSSVISSLFSKNEDEETPAKQKKVKPVARSELSNPVLQDIPGVDEVEVEFDAKDYIRKQVNLQTYGKEEPSEYDRLLVRLKERTQ